jgi:hypothetical protein
MTLHNPLRFLQETKSTIFQYVLPSPCLAQDLILKVLNTVPSKREARNFVERFANSKYHIPKNTPSSVNASTSPSSPFLQQNTPLPISLVKLQGPFPQKHILSNACSTLTLLQKLGLSSIVVIDNGEYLQSNVHSTGKEKNNLVYSGWRRGF